MSGSVSISGSANATANFTLQGHLRLDPGLDPGSNNLTASYLFTSASNTTTGYDLYYRQQNNLVKFKWIEGGISTGLLYGGGISYSGSTIYVKKGSGIINNSNATSGSEINPIFTYITWNDYTASATYITSSQNTYLYVDPTGTVRQQTSFFNQTQYEQEIPLGRVTHPNYTSITGYGSNVQTTYDDDSQQNDFIRAFGPIKVSGFSITAQPASLRFGVGSGIAFNLGGFYTQDPNSPSHYEGSGFVTASIARAWRSGSGIYLDNNGGAFYTTVDPDYWDDGTGVLNTMASSEWQIQRVFANPVTGRVVVYYGQNTYTTLLNALQYLATDSFVEGEFTAKSLLFIGYLVLKGQTNNLADTANNKIIDAGIFRNIAGGSSGGGAVAQTLEDLSDVTITTPTNNQALVYSGGTWVNGNPLSSSFASTASLPLRGLITGSVAGATLTFTKGDGTTFDLTVAQSGTVSTASYVTSSGVYGPNGSNSILSSSFAATAALAPNYVLNSSTGSFITNAQTSSFVLNSQTSSMYVASASQAATASSADNFTVRGTLTAQTIVTQTITSSTDFVTGSTRFGTLYSNTHIFTGSVSMNQSGSGIPLTLNGSNLTSATANKVLEVLGSGGTSIFSPRSNGLVYIGTGQLYFEQNGLTAKYYDSRLEFGISTITTASANANNSIYGGLKVFSWDGSVSNPEVFRVQGNGNVGINTTSPSAKLNISGSNTDAILQINSPASASILVVSGSGNVGIGIGVPLAPLHVVGSVIALRATLANGSGGVISNDSTTTYFQALTSTNDAREFNIAGQNVIFRSGASTYTEGFRLASTGNVGIGTTSPTALLDVNGTGRFTNTLTISSSASNGALVIQQSSVGFAAQFVNRADITNAIGQIAFSDLKTGAGNRSFGIGIGRSGDPQWTNGDFIFAYYSGSGTWQQSAKIFNTSGNWIIGTSSLDEGFKLDVNGTARINGATTITGSLTVTQGITGSLFGTSSWAQNAITASYISASNIAGLSLSQISLGVVTASVNASSNLFNIVSGSNTLVVVNNVGNVGIGTTNPTAPLYLNYATASSTEFVINNSISSLAGPSTAIRFITPVSSINKTSGRISSYYTGNGFGSTAISLQPATGNEVVEDVLVANGNKSVYIYGTVAPAAASTYTIFRLERPTNPGPAYSNRVDFDLGMWGTIGAPAANSQLQIKMSSGLSSTVDTNVFTINASGSLPFIGINNTSPTYNLDVSGSTRLNGNAQITGSLTVTQGITGSLFGTSSWAQNAVTSSYILQAVSASFASTAANATTASYILQAASASFASTAALAPLYVLTSATSSMSVASASQAATASSADNFTVRGTLTAQTIVAQTITSSTDYVTGSTRFGSIITNTHQFIGSVSISGSLNITGSGYFSDSVGIGSTTLTANGFRVSKTITGGTIANNIFSDGTIQSDVTSQAFYYRSLLRTQAATFNVSDVYHYFANGGTLGTNSTITNQYGFLAEANITQATNNFGFYGNIPSASNRWNLYMNGTADNYFAGRLGIGPGKTVPSAQLDISGSILITGSLSVTQGITSSLFGTSSWANNAVTSSYILQAVSASFATTSSFASNGGVTQIIAGTNITISPTNGLGAVTINSSGGGGASFPYTGSAIITGSLIVTGSTTSTLGFTGSLFGTSSFTLNIDGGFY